MITLAQILIQTRTFRRENEQSKRYDSALEFAKLEKLLEDYVQQEKRRES